jgi:hypothetical protein
MNSFLKVIRTVVENPGLSIARHIMVIFCLLDIEVINCLGTTIPDRFLSIGLRWQRAPFVPGLLLFFKQPLLLALQDVDI